MSIQRPNDRRRRRIDHFVQEDDKQRWLLTYADMITLLMALFIVMWSISVTNGTKFEQLKLSLKEALSAKGLLHQKGILNGENGILEPNGTPTRNITPRAAQANPPYHEVGATGSGLAARLAREDLENLERVRVEIERYAISHHLSEKIRTSIDERGLVIRLLSDDLLFNTGHAELRPGALPVLRKISRLLVSKRIPNDLRVEGNTDDVPISNALFRSNWELSTTRATVVLQKLLELGLAPDRLSAAGYADQRPVAPNPTADGRQLNRRVDLVVLRRALGRLAQ